MASKRDLECPFARRLHETVAQRLPPEIPNAGQALFERLLALEEEAKAAGAPSETLAAIANARFMAGVSTLRPWFPMPRGH